jgi:hypothetical protein
VVAFGASLTQGTQDATISVHSQTHSAVAQLARAAGFYLSLPLVRPGFLPALTHDDFDRGRCRLTGGLVSILLDRAQDELLPKLRDSNGNLVIAKARVDPALEARNVAIGGMKVGQVIHGAGTAFGIGLEHFVWNPQVDTVNLLYEPDQKMIDRVVALEPTLVLSTDLVINDYNNVELDREGIPDLSELTPLPEFSQALATLLARLEQTGAEVFLASGPDVTELPRYGDKVAELRARGYSEVEATAWRDAIRRRIDEYNAELLRQVQGRPRFHVVDVHGRVAEVMADGLWVGDRHLRPDPFGGLLSLDSMHFSDTGYAVLANDFVRAINEALGTSVPEIDLAAVMAGDPNSVDALRAAGFDCAGR